MILRHLLHRALRIGSLLLITTVIWAGWYLHFRGVGKSWRQFVCDEFSKQGVELSMQRLTLDPMEGLVARDVRIIEKRDRKRTLACINRLALDLSIANILQHQPFLNAVDCRDAELLLPLDPILGNGQSLTVKKLNARILFPPHQIYISQAEAEVFGIHFSAAGRLNNPERLHLGNTGEKNAKSEEVVHGSVLELLKKIRFEGGAPRVQVRFSGDLAQPKKIFAEATVSGEEIALGNYRLNSLSARLTCRDQICSLQRFSLRDAKGSLEASGELQIPDRSWQAQLRSNLSLQDIGRFLNGPSQLRELQFDAPPFLEISAHGDPVVGPRIVGKVSLGEFRVRLEKFQSLNASFSIKGKDWYLRDFRLEHGSGQIDLSAMQLPGNFRARLLSTINPGAFLPLLTGKAAEVLGEWDFVQTPEVTLNVSGTNADLLSCAAIGQVHLGNTRLRGVPMKGATATIRIKDRAFSYENFRVEREEGVATGNFTYDFAKHEVRLNQIKTHVVPSEVAMWIDPKLVKDVVPYKFKAPPNLSINGIVGTNGGKQTNLEILVDGPEGMDYVFLKKNLSAQKISGKLLFTDGRLKITNLLASLYSGTLRGTADISLRREDPFFSGQVQVENIEFPKITKIYFNYETSKGELTGKYAFSGRGDNARLLQGTGELKVVEGNVFAIPLLGPLTGVLSSILPGVGYDIAHEARASFKMAKGIVETNDFLVKGSGFSMLGEGKLFFADDKIDFNIRINAQGVPGAILFPVSKLFEYSGEGSLSKPVWRPKRLPNL